VVCGWKDDEFEIDTPSSSDSSQIIKNNNIINLNNTFKNKTKISQRPSADLLPVETLVN